MLVSQISSTFLKGDSICNVMAANHEIARDEGIDSRILVDFISEYESPDIYEFLSRDIKGVSLSNTLSDFMHMRNKMKYMAMAAKSFITYQPKKALDVLEKSDIRVWHNSSFLKSSYLMHKGDILYFHNYTLPYLRDYINGKVEMELRLELIAHNDLDLVYITPSEFNRKSLDKLGVRYSEVKVIPLFHRYDLPRKVISHEKPVLLGYGRYAKNKKVPELAKLCSEAKIPLIYFGDTNTLEEHDSEYARASKYADDCVTLLGKVDNFEDYFNISNIYVNNSDFEGFSLTTVEAMAHSFPVILRSGSAMDDFFEKASSLGLRIGYSYDNVDEIPSLVELIMQEYEKFSEDAWKLSKEFTFDKYRKAYLSVLNEKRR
jgi:Glycosyl transferases group 1